MRICFFSRRYFPAISGMSVYAQNLLRELVRAGDDVTMISQYRGDPKGSRIYGGGPPPAVPGVTVIGLEARGEQNGGDFETDVDEMVTVAVREHRRMPFDLLHAQYCYPTGLAALEASRRLGIPNVVSVQGGDGHWVGLCCATHKTAMLAVLNHAGSLLIGSRSFAEEVHRNHGTPLDRFTIVPGAVDIERFTPGQNHHPLVLLYHGRVDRRKGALDMLDAIAKLKSPPRLIVSGIGPDTAAVTDRVAELGLAGTVEQTGYVSYDDVPAVYHRGDIFLSPTYAEGFSNTILEAMASGLPVISCRAVGVVDCLRDGENGLLVEPGDIPALAVAIERTIADPDLRRTLRKRALEEVRQLYSWPAVAEQIRAEYTHLLRTTPDLDWAMPEGRAECRFRAEPHLL